MPKKNFSHSSSDSQNYVSNQPRCFCSYFRVTEDRNTYKLLTAIKKHLLKSRKFYFLHIKQPPPTNQPEFISCFLPTTQNSEVDCYSNKLEDMRTKDMRF